MASRALLQKVLITTSTAILVCLGLTSCSFATKKAPHLSFDPDLVDIGKVEEGAEVPTFFTLKNTGSEPLKIHEATSSCGCTVPELKQQELQPGESTKLDIIVDTTMKQGNVTKTVEVSSNDPDAPVVSLPIKMNIANRHEGLTDDGRVKIFTDEKCNSCHVLRGVGLVGKDLFEADCAMCHGEDARGAVGGPLIFGNYNDPKYEKHIRDVISYGSKTHRSMPGFLDKAGGPLVQEQVDSLIRYLKELSEKEKTKAKTNSAGRNQKEAH
jgi:hypothetical protein